MRLKMVLLATASFSSGTAAFAQDAVVTTTTGQPEQPGLSASVGQPAPQGAATAQTPQEVDPDPAVQETLPATAQTAPGNDIVVTGSRIRRDSFSASVPINVVTETDLESAGFTNLAEAIADLPEAALGDTPLGPTAGENQNSGLATVSLRNIGGNRTLTLIDGRRTVSNAANRNVVSLNTVPIDFVERVEIITGAASAIYGSDGIAGVVNLITRDNFDGLRLTSRFGTTLVDRWGGEEYQFSALAGKKFAGNRGHVLVGVSYENDVGLKASDRNRALQTSSFNYLTNVVTTPSLTNLLPGGWFNTTNAATSYFYDEDGTLRRGFVQNRDGYDINPFLNLRTPRSSLSVAGKARFEVSDAFQPFVTIMYNKLDTQFERTAGGINSATQVFPRDPATGVIEPGTLAFTPGRIARNHPFAPPEISAGATATGIAWYRRFNEVGPIRFTEDRETIRAWAGIRGSLWTDWNYEVSYGLGDFRQNQLRENGLNLLNVRNALTIEPNGTGGLRCTSAEARDQGCVPLNIFGPNSISPEAADYIRANTTLEAHLRQHVLQGYATGDIVTLPAGDVSVAFGAEYRRDSSELESDPITRTGYTTNAVVPSFKGSITVKEAFAETTIPILARKPGFHDLSLDLAARVGDYDIRNVGTVFSYRVGGSYAPTPDIRFRAQWGTAQRAPDLAELTSPPRDDINTIIDPCDGITATTAGIAAANCRREAGIAAAIAENGEFQQSTTSIQSPNAGNPELKEESARTLTLGAVVQPRALPGLSLALDYYDIRIKDAIDAFSNEIVLDQCYSSNSYPTNQFCDVITRSEETGQLQQVIQAQQNLNRLRVSGFDLHAAYRTSLDKIGLPGRISLNVDWTHLIRSEIEYQTLTGPEVETFEGTIGDPSDRVRARVGYTFGNNYLQWRTNYIGPVISSNTRLAQIRELGIQDPLYLYYKDYFRHDVYYSHTARFGTQRVQFYAGVNNIFNKSGPIIPNGGTPGAFSSYSSTYGVIGRYGYFGFEFKL